MCLAQTKHGILLFKVSTLSFYLGKLKLFMIRFTSQRNVASTDVTPTHGMVLELIWKVEEAGHKIFVGNYFTTQNFSMIYTAGK
jgi:hypothetical protein